MKELILNKLKTLQEDYSIEILFACETGSRAWGFPSPDSDYDVRFIYKHKKEWYLSLSEKKDSIELMLENGDYDLSGWDLRKSLRLLQKGNAPLIERFTSPIVYIESSNFKSEMLGLIEANYNRISVFYHHFSLASKIWDEQKYMEYVKLKKLFYLLRSLLSCRYVSSNSTVVPMNIYSLMTEMSDEINTEIEALIKVKANESEKFQHQITDSLRNWIERNITNLSIEKNSLNEVRKNVNALENYFIKTIS